MELGLSLGTASKPCNGLKQLQHDKGCFGFCMSLGLNSAAAANQEPGKSQKCQENDEDDRISGGDDNQRENPLQLNLLPLAPVPGQISSHPQSLPWSSDNGSSGNGSSGNMGLPPAMGLDASRKPAAEVSSANSVGSPFHMDIIGMYGKTGNGNLAGGKRDFEATGNDGVEAERASSRASDDDENGLNTRKKLRLSKEQSAFLEESFKQHNTLTPRQKLALAKQLNLRPRQVEVWFQNRRARTKLKQTEVDCEYLKKCCETLTEENRRLHKELQELRALKTSNPFYTQFPATTLIMCPSCERVATATTTTTRPTASAVTAESADSTPKAITLPLTRPRFNPFSQTPTNPNQPTHL